MKAIEPIDEFSGKSRFEELDALRALAAIGVIAWHYTHAFNASPFAHLLAPFYGRGLLMVDFFFVLSGFVIARAFWTERRATAFVDNARARLARMYPLHLVMLLVVVLLQAVLTLGFRVPASAQNDAYHFILNILLLNSSGLQHGFSFNAPSWSISTEFLINLLFLGCITLPGRMAKPLLAVIGIVCLATMAHRGVINGTRAFGWIDNDLIRTCAGFLTGVLLERVHARLVPLRRHAAWDLVLLICVAAILRYLALGPYNNASEMAICYVGFPLVIASAVRSQWVASVLRAKPLVYLGSISYSIYLVHYPLMLALTVSDVAGHKPSYANPWFFLAFVATVLMVASVTYRLVELPGKRWLGARGRRTISGPATATAD